MIPRTLAHEIKKSISKYPVIAITGPRQSGKTTLVKNLLPEYTYINLEDVSMRNYAKSDPKDFLETYTDGVIIDEIQYAPELFSYLQVYTDARGRNGEYVITGSQNFLMMENISQSLAGRVALFNLLPLAVSELTNTKYELPSWEEYLLSGGYPRKWVNDIPSFDFYDNYINTYVERDVRMIKNINNLDLFQKFIHLLAGRTGQLFNQSSVGQELGLDNKTIHSWMSLLEASFIAFRLKPYYKNFNKRITKTPKIYFYDTGMLAYLLGIRTTQDLNLHFAKGQLFENFILLELIKRSLNRKTYEKFFFWRENSGYEIDVLIEDGMQLSAVEIKSGKTINKDFFRNLGRFRAIYPEVSNYLVYGGDGIQIRSECTVVNYRDLDKLH